MARHDQDQAAGNWTNRIAHSLIEQHALFERLKELRRQGKFAEAQELARFLELLDRADDWAMRYA